MLVEAGAGGGASRLADLGYEANETEFKRAVAEGSVEAVDLFLDAGFDPRWHGEISEGWIELLVDPPLLSDAATSGHADVARSLLNAGADGALGLRSVLNDMVVDLDAIRLLLDAGASPNSQVLFEVPFNDRLLEQFLIENDLAYLLSGSMAVGHPRELFEVVRLFVDHGLDLNAINQEGETIFHTVVTTWTDSTPDILRLLVDAGGDVNMAGAGAVSPILLTRVSLGASLAPGEVETLLTLGADPDLRDSNGRNAVLIAAEEGTWETLSVLIAAGADFSTPDDSGDTALLHALLQGNTEMARTLLDAGADVPDETTAQLYLATAEGNDAGIDAALSGGPSAEDLNGALLIAIRIENDSALSRLLAAGANPDSPDEDGNPILFEAVLSDRMEVVDALLSAGAGLDARNSSNETVPEVAATAGSPTVMSALLENGLDPNTSSEQGPTLLMRTASAGSLGVAFLFGSVEALEPKTYWEERQAGFSDYAEAAGLLIDRGANVNATTAGGDTALIRAVMVGNGPVVRLLIESGVDLDHRNQLGRTALMQAREGGEGFEFLVDMLVEAGAGGGGDGG